MSGLVAKLRAKRVRGRPGFYNPDELCQEAANEIERLSVALALIASLNGQPTAQDIAKTTLQQEQPK